MSSWFLVIKSYKKRKQQINSRSKCKQQKQLWCSMLCCLHFSSPAPPRLCASAPPHLCAFHPVPSTSCLPPRAFHLVPSTSCLPPRAFHLVPSTSCLPPRAFHFSILGFHFSILGFHFSILGFHFSILGFHSFFFNFFFLCKSPLTRLQKPL